MVIALAAAALLLSPAPLAVVHRDRTGDCGACLPPLLSFRVGGMVGLVRIEQDGPAATAKPATWAPCR